MAASSLTVGCRYQAIGPAAGSRLGPPPEVEVIAIDEDRGRYVTTGQRQCATTIAFGCERFWLEVAAEQLPI